MTDAERIAAATDVLAKELGTDPEYATLEGCADALAHHHQLMAEELAKTRQHSKALEDALRAFLEWGEHGGCYTGSDIATFTRKFKCALGKEASVLCPTCGYFASLADGVCTKCRHALAGKGGK